MHSSNPVIPSPAFNSAFNTATLAFSADSAIVGGGDFPPSVMNAGSVAESAVPEAAVSAGKP